MESCAGVGASSRVENALPPPTRLSAAACSVCQRIAYRGTSLIRTAPPP